METFFRANTGFTALSPEELLSQAKRVLTGLTDNATIFATPSPALTVLSGNIDDLEAKINEFNAMQGGGVLTNQRNDKMPPLIETLIKLGTYVQGIAQGDKTKILLGGFDASGDKTTVGELPAPDNFQVETLRGGKVELSCDKVKGSNSYVWEYTPAPVTGSSVWNTETSTKRQVGLSGFPAGIQFAFRVRAVGANIAKNYSAIVYDYTR